MNLKRIMRVADGRMSGKYRVKDDAAHGDFAENVIKAVEEAGCELGGWGSIVLKLQPNNPKYFYLDGDLPKEILDALRNDKSADVRSLTEHIVSIRLVQKIGNRCFFEPVFDESGQRVWEELNGKVFLDDGKMSELTEDIQAVLTDAGYSDGQEIKVDVGKGTATYFDIDDNLTQKILNRLEREGRGFGKHLKTLIYNEEYDEFVPVFEDKWQEEWDDMNERYSRGVSSYYASKGSGGYTGD